MGSRACGVEVEFGQVCRRYIEHGNESGESGIFIRCVPVARDLPRVVQIHNWIKNRLVNQARRKFAHPGVPEKRQFLKADWTEEFRRHRMSNLSGSPKVKKCALAAFYRSPHFSLLRRTW